MGTNQDKKEQNEESSAVLLLRMGRVAWCSWLAVLCCLHQCGGSLPVHRRSTSSAFAIVAPKHSVRTDASRQGWLASGGRRPIFVCQSKHNPRRRLSTSLLAAQGDTVPENLKSDPWLIKKANELEERYSSLLEEAISQLDQQRQKDPVSVPESSYAMMESMLQEEFEAERDKIIEDRAAELMEAIESKKMEELENADLSEAQNDVVRQIMDEADAEADRLDTVQTKMESFTQYERDALRRAEETPVELPEDKSNMDEWALGQMEDMLSKTQSETSGAVAENLEKSIQELRTRLETKIEPSPIQPETMKDWQMYRSIATRFAKENAGPETTDEAPGPRRNSTEDEETIAAQLESWKDFQRKEQEYRQLAGLAGSGVKMPFEWQEPGTDPMDVLKPPEAFEEDDRTPTEIRRDINQKALEAMEQLVSQGTIRSERLAQKIEELRNDLASPDYLKEEIKEPKEELVIEPIDLSDVFGDRKSSRKRRTPTPQLELEDEVKEVRVSPIPSPIDKISPLESDRWETMEPSSPPDTPFFSDGGEEIGSVSPTTKNSIGDIDTEPEAPPPDTPFFSDDNDDDLQMSTNAPQKGASKLGTLEEQKLRSMYQRAGARTEAEQKELRTQWEAFQEYEKKSRDMSGLSDSSDSLEEASAMYNVSDVMTEDGDIDAAKVLASIGPRPTRKNRTASASSSAGERTPTESKVSPDPALRVAETVVEPSADASSNLNVKEEKRLDDKKSKGAVNPKVTTNPVDVDQLSQAENRISDRDQEADQYEEASMDGLIPDWFQKDEAGSRSTSYTQTEYGDEFARGQMGIDISDVFDHEENYDDGRVPVRNNWARPSSFTSRKARLLEATELSVRDVNSLMDHKDSPYTTGVSSYMKRINRPFWAFGTIFRLEGALLEVNGLQYKAWKKVAEKHGFVTPEFDDVRRASVSRPEIAVRKIFFWSDDLLVCREVASSHREAVREVFDQWMADNGITENAQEIGRETSVTGKTKEEGESITVPESSTVVGTVSIDSAVPISSDKNMLEIEFMAWKATAEECGFEEPYPEQAMASMVINDPNILVSEGFAWSSEPSEVKRIVRIFEEAKSELLRGRFGIQNTPQPRNMQKSGESSRDEAPSITQQSMLEIEFLAWKHTAVASGLAEPFPEEAMAAMVINDPEILVRDGFGWADDQSEVDRLVGMFEAAKSKILEERYDRQHIPQPDAPIPKKEETTAPKSREGPTEQEILEMNVFSWTVAAEKHGFEPPPLEKMQLATDTDTEKAITSIFGWTNDADLIEQVSATYREARQMISARIIEKYNLDVDGDLASELPVPQVVSELVDDSKTPTDDEVFDVIFDAWIEVAELNSFPLPIYEEIVYAITVGAENAIRDGFKWSTDPVKVKEVAGQFTKALETTYSKLARKYNIDKSSISPPVVAKEAEYEFFTVAAGAAKWIQSLIDIEIPCAVFSYLEGYQVDVLLEQAGLANLIPRDKRVSMSSGYLLESQQLLGAALRLERRPDHCVVFDTTPESAASAHDAEMKCVGMTGIYPRFNLLSADSTARYFSDFSPMNLRSLFGERVDDEPMLDMKDTQPKSPPLMKTKFWDEGDRR